MDLENTSCYHPHHYAASREARKGDQLINRFRNPGKGTQGTRQAARAQRLLQRTNYDIEMMRRSDIVLELYSRYMDGRKPGASYTLLDYFPDDF